MGSVWNQITQYLCPSISEDEAARNKHTSSPPVFRAELQIPQALVERYEADQYENTTREGERSRVDRNRYWVEFATLVFAILGFVILFCTLKITRDTMINAERAWVVINDIRGRDVTKKEEWVIVTINDEFKLRLEFINAGNGPATDVIVRAGSMFLLDESQFNCRFNPTDSSSMSISVLAGRGIGNPLLHDLTVRDATPANVELVNAGKKTLLIGGEVEYRDQFNIQRWTSFCSTLTPSGKGLNFTYCKCGNELK